MDGDCYQLLRCTALRANFLVESLQDLDQNLKKVGSRLYVASGDPAVVLPELWKEFDITHLTYEEDETEEPYALQRDKQVNKLAEKHKIQVDTFAQETLHPLGSYLSKAGSKVPNTMGAFQKIFGGMPPVADSKPAPKKADFPEQEDKHPDKYLPPKKPTDLPWPRNIPKAEVTPLWGPDDCKNLTPIVRGGETRALELLDRKMKNVDYVATFQKPETSCTSKSPSTTALSPFMSLGCLSPREFWYAIEDACQKSKAKNPSKPPVSLHGQLLWRDFNNLMTKTANQDQPGSWGQMEGNMHCRNIPWSDDPQLLQRWQNGETGYPWIDACMRQLKTEGWIHHLGRHAVACFLTRGDLWQSWEKGAEHFESHLLDADYALNGFNWLWLSCSGFFYQYFRCYSPISFQKKNDPSGQYIRKYLPKLKNLPDKYIYEPWKAPPEIQKRAGVVIGKDYPEPIVEHSTVSKDNMSLMADAYERHKQREKPKRSAVTKSTNDNKKRKTK